MGKTCRRSPASGSRTCAIVKLGRADRPERAHGDSLGHTEALHVVEAGVEHLHPEEPPSLSETFGKLPIPEDGVRDERVRLVHRRERVCAIRRAKDFRGLETGQRVAERPLASSVPDEDAFHVIANSAASACRAESLRISGSIAIAISVQAMPAKPSSVNRRV